MRVKRFKTALLVSCLLLLLCAFSFGLAEASGQEEAVFTLPSALTEIQSGAFEGTAASVVYLPDRISRIDSRTFADMPNLRTVYIPRATRYIADDAFSGTKDLTIRGHFGSYAQIWALIHHLRFEHIEVWGLNPFGWDWAGKPCPLSRVKADSEDPHKPLFANLLEADIFASPKDKPEMYPVDYDFP